MTSRLVQLALVLVVVLQPSVLCACAVEHAFFCGTGHDIDHPAAVDSVHGSAVLDGACRAASADCRGHRERAACGSRESVSGSYKAAPGLGVPALPAFAADGSFQSSHLVARFGFDSTSSESPPGSDRSVPLLN